MATAETARLIASLEMRDNGFTRTADAATRKVDGLSARIGKIGNMAGQGLRTAAGNIAKIGAVAGAGLLLAARSGLQDLATLEDAVTSVDGAIKQMGLTGRTSGAQIAAWANEIEASVQAAFDDKDITAATATLIRFGKVTPQNLRPAMRVMTDLAAKTGSVDSAAQLLAKAMIQPEKAATRLLRSGVILTKNQQKQIELAIKQGKTGKAQALVLDAVRKSTEGAAKASAGPYRDAMNLLTDAFEDGRKALAEGFMPLIQRFAGEASEFFGRPETITRIREFGNSLADVAEGALDFAKRIPWATIGDGLGKAADFAGKLVDAFKGMPPEVQATIIALAGLDKLSGGAISGIVSELGKGLIKGVLGMTAAVVNLRAARVTGLGAVPGPTSPTAPGGAPITRGRLINAAGQLLLIGTVAAFADEINTALQGAARDLRAELKVDDFWSKLGVDKLPIPQSWPWGPKNTPTILPEVFGGNGLLGGSGATGRNRGTAPRGEQFGPPAPGDGRVTGGSWEKASNKITAEQAQTTDVVKIGNAKAGEILAAIGQAARSNVMGHGTTARSAIIAGVLAAAATTAAGGRVAGAIAAKDMSAEVYVSTTVNVSAGGLQRTSTTVNNYGRSNASSGGGRDSGGNDARRSYFG